MAYSESGDVRHLKEGYLLKSPDSHRYLSVLKRWQRKWFRLMEGGDLHYFDSDKSSKPVGTLHLLNCQRVFDSKTRGLQFSYCLGLEIGETTHYIKADTSHSFNSWLEMVAGFAEKNEATAVSVSPSPPGHRRNSGLPETRGHRGESAGSRTASVSAKLQSKSADKSGWLYKTGPNNKGWNHRFFVLFNGTLSYFRTEKAEKSLGTIDLRECTAVSQATVKKGYGLTIQVPNRTYYITAETETDQHEWIAALTMAISILEGSKLSVGATEALVRSESGSSGSSVTSRELSTSDTITPATASEGEVLLGVEEQTGDGGLDKRVEKDSVVQLLEAEVDALRGQVKGLCEELQSSGSVRVQLQSQLEQSARQREREVHSITVDRDNLHAKLLELEGAKQSLESVNDSLRLQLDEIKEAGLEAEQLGVQGELEEAQVALSTAEEDIKTYQQELSDTQQLLQEIQSVALDLQAELIRRGDFVPDHFHKKRSLSSTASELLSSPDITSSSPSLDTHLEAEEREEGNEDTVKGERDTLPPSDDATVTASNEVGGEVGGATLAEERLKWQMEMENLRRECEAREGVERDRCEEAVRGWRVRVEKMEQRCRVMSGEVEAERERGRELELTRQRVGELEGELSVARERVTQLQVEKEKALSDLNNIRKINRTMEKKLSETGKQDSAEPRSPPVSSGKVEELSRQLELVKKERDQLKAELEELKASIANRAARTGDDNVMKLSPFRTRKTRATVAASRHSFAAPTMPSPLANGYPEEVPVKPQRPSKTVVTQRLAAAAQSQDTSSRPRTWTATIFQNLLHN